MTVHLLATVNQEHQVLNDIDFETLLKLSNNQCVIIENSLYDYLGSLLPDRMTVVVGMPSEGAVINSMIARDVDQAFSFFEAMVQDTCIVVGRSAEFLGQALAYTDVVHLTTLQDQGEALEATVELPDSIWRCMFKDEGVLNQYTLKRDQSRIRSRHRRFSGESKWQKNSR